MNVRLTLVAAAMLAITGIATAHDCSGGPDGGMDATGNDCSDVKTVAALPTPPAVGQGDSKPARRPAASRSPRTTIAGAPERVARGSNPRGR